MVEDGLWGLCVRPEAGVVVAGMGAMPGGLVLGASTIWEAAKASPLASWGEVPVVSARVGDLEGAEALGAVALEVVALGVVALEVVAMEEVLLGVAVLGLGALVLPVPQGASKR